MLRIPYDAVEQDIKWEDPKAEVCGPRGGEGVFPVRYVMIAVWRIWGTHKIEQHLYNGLKLGKDEIDSVVVLEKNDSGWDEALKKAQEWLIY